MVLVGLLLVAAAAGFTTDLFVENSHPVPVDVLGHTFTVAPGWIAVTGIVALAVLAVGARFIAHGVGRARRRRSLLRDARSAARERDELARQLAAERAMTDAAQTAIDRNRQPPEAVVAARVVGVPEAQLDTPI
jgi:hypothetical protein